MQDVVAVVCDCVRVTIGNGSYSGDCPLLVPSCFDGNFKTFCLNFELKHKRMSPIKITTYDI